MSTPPSEAAIFNCLWTTKKFETLWVRSALGYRRVLAMKNIALLYPPSRKVLSRQGWKHSFVWTLMCSSFRTPYAKSWELKDRDKDDNNYPFDFRKDTLYSLRCEQHDPVRTRIGQWLSLEAKGMMFSNTKANSSQWETMHFLGHYIPKTVVDTEPRRLLTKESAASKWK